jgi:choline dehydrogenase
MHITELPGHVATLVIGAGTGGCAFTNIHATHSTDDILLVEAGPDYGARSSGCWPADVLDARSVPLSHDWRLTGVGSVGCIRDLPRARIIGGCSSHNGCAIARSAHADYDDWARCGNPGWDAASVEPLLDWAHAQFRTSHYRMNELTNAQAAFVRAGIEAGMPFADDLDGMAAAVGIGPMPVNIVNGVRFNAAFAFLDPIRDLDHVHIAADTPVQHIVIERGRVAGVALTASDGQPTVVRAERVVLAAGAYHSPALLQRSGVGPADRLRTLGIRSVVNLPGVGEHLLDHACVQLNFRGKDGLLAELAQTPWNADEQSVGRARSSRCDNGPYDMHVFMVSGANSGHPGLPPISLYGAAMRAKSEGRVTITGADGTIAVDHRYGTDPDGNDLAVLGEALLLLEEMITRPQLAAILGKHLRAKYPPTANIASYCHPAGTCAMGPESDPAAVVDATGQVHGVADLHVADASIMPAITRANINLPTAMIGARIATQLLNVAPAPPRPFPRHQRRTERTSP